MENCTAREFTADLYNSAPAWMVADVCEKNNAYVIIDGGKITDVRKE